MFSAIRIRKSADLIPDADIFFIINVNSFMVQYRKQCFNMFKVTLFIYLCVWKRGGMLFFSPLWGGHAILLSRNRGGGQHFLSYSEALSAIPPPSTEIYKQSLNTINFYAEKLIVAEVC